MCFDLELGHMTCFCLLPFLSFGFSLLKVISPLLSDLHSFEHLPNSRYLNTCSSSSSFLFYHSSSSSTLILVPSFYCPSSSLITHLPAQPQHNMPYNWDHETERALLLLAMQHSDFKPNASIWNAVAQGMSGALTASAVSYV